MCAARRLGSSSMIAFAIARASARSVRSRKCSVLPAARTAIASSAVSPPSRWSASSVARTLTSGQLSGWYPSLRPRAPARRRHPPSASRPGSGCRIAPMPSIPNRSGSAARNAPIDDCDPGHSDSQVQRVKALLVPDREPGLAELAIDDQDGAWLHALAHACESRPGRSAARARPQARAPRASAAVNDGPRNATPGPSSTHDIGTAEGECGSDHAAAAPPALTSIAPDTGGGRGSGQIGGIAAGGDLVRLLLRQLGAERSRNPSRISSGVASNPAARTLLDDGFRIRPPATPAPWPSPRRPPPGRGMRPPVPDSCDPLQSWRAHTASAWRRC